MSIDAPTIAELAKMARDAGLDSETTKVVWLDQGALPHATLASVMEPVEDDPDSLDEPVIAVSS